MQVMKPEEAAVALGIHTNTVRKYAPLVEGAIYQRRPLLVDIEALWAGMGQIDPDMYGGQVDVGERIRWVQGQGQAVKEAQRQQNRAIFPAEQGSAGPVEQAEHTEVTDRITPAEEEDRTNDRRLNEIAAGVNALATRREGTIEARVRAQLEPVLAAAARRAVWREWWYVVVSLLVVIAGAVGGVIWLQGRLTASRLAATAAATAADERAAMIGRMDRQVAGLERQITGLEGQVAELRGQGQRGQAEIERLQAARAAAAEDIRRLEGELAERRKKNLDEAAGGAYREDDRIGAAAGMDPQATASPSAIDIGKVDYGR